MSKDGPLTLMAVLALLKVKPQLDAVLSLDLSTDEKILCLVGSVITTEADSASFGARTHSKTLLKCRF